MQFEKTGRVELTLLTTASPNFELLQTSYRENCSSSKALTNVARCSISFCLSSCVLATTATAISSPPSSSSSTLASRDARLLLRPLDVADMAVGARPSATDNVSSLFAFFDLRERRCFFGASEVLPLARLMVSMLGERE
jgi:hypothetical protein